MTVTRRRVALVGAEHEENLALRYLAAALESAGHAVSIIPFNREHDVEAAAEALAASGAALAGFSMVFTYRAREFARVARRARALGWRGHLVAGGHFAAFHAEQLLHDEPAFDSVALGEGEELMTRLAGDLEHPGAVPGLVWRTQAGAIERNQPLPPLEDLDQRSWPTRKQPPDRFLGLPIANVLGSRGCLGRCAFCSISAWHRLCGGARFRARAPERVAEEIGALYRQGYRIFNFHDDNFFLPDPAAMRVRVDRLESALLREGVGRIAFAVKSRPDSVERDLFARLKRRGLFRVFLGVEAGTVESLRRLGRGQVPEDNERALGIVNDLDLHACFNLLLLNPASTLEDVRGNLAWMRTHARNPMNFCRTEVYAGTPLEEHLRRRGELTGDYWGYGYRIRDPGAQTFFELMHMILAGRHHGLQNVHHLTMSLDYERVLLDRFYRCPPELARRVQAFTRGVNLESYRWLERLAARAARGFASDDERRAYVRETEARVSARNLAQTREGETIRAALRRVAEESRRSDAEGWRRQAAAAGVAATLALASMPQRVSGATQTMEMAAEPSPAQIDRIPPTQVFEMIAEPSPPEPAAATAAYAREADAAFNRNALPALATLVRPAVSFDVALTIKPDGAVRDITIGKPGQAKGEAETPAAGPAEAARIEALIQQLGASDFSRREKASQSLAAEGTAAEPFLEKALATTSDPEVRLRCQNLLNRVAVRLELPRQQEVLALLRGQRMPRPGKETRYVRPVTARELNAMWERLHIQTQICEMAPAPRD